jgi:hypothetical protein
MDSSCFSDRVGNVFLKSAQRRQADGPDGAGITNRRQGKAGRQAGIEADLRGFTPLSALPSQ